jgi:lipopolysaccharide export system protein LptA
MKKIISILMAGWCGLAVAQMNTPLSLRTNAPAARPHGPTQINSDAADFDLNIHQGIYRGHVLVLDPSVRLTCEWLVVDLPQGGEHLSHVVAVTNVVIDFIDSKGQTNHVTAAQAVYDYKVVNVVTNETVTFTGNPVVETPDMTIYSEPLVWDRAANKYHFTEPRMIPREGISTNGAAKFF